MKYPNHRRANALAVASALLLIAACSTPAQTSKREPSDTNVVARVGDREITLAEVDEKALASNMQAFQQLYNARREALDEIVAEALLEREAASRGITPEELVSQEITSETEPVTDEDVDRFYEQNRSRLAGQTLDQIGEQIRSYLESRNASLARQSFLDELREKANVDVRLDPPRIPVQVAENERVKGPPDAEVTIVEYSDFQ